MANIKCRACRPEKATMIIMTSLLIWLSVLATAGDALGAGAGRAKASALIQQHQKQELRCEQLLRGLSFRKGFNRNRHSYGAVSRFSRHGKCMQLRLRQMEMARMSHHFWATGAVPVQTNLKQ